MEEVTEIIRGTAGKSEEVEKKSASKESEDKYSGMDARDRVFAQTMWRRR